MVERTCNESACLWNGDQRMNEQERERERKEEKRMNE